MLTRGRVASLLPQTCLINVFLDFKEAALNGSQFTGVSIDLSKAFDNIPDDTALEVMRTGRKGTGETMGRKRRSHWFHCVVRMADTSLSG